MVPEDMLVLKVYVNTQSKVHVESLGSEGFGTYNKGGYIELSEGCGKIYTVVPSCEVIPD